MASKTSGMNSDGWSLNEWGNSKTAGKKIPDWPDDASNAAFDFNDRDQSMKKQESKCSKSSDCGSGFACVGGYCVKVDGRSATGGGSGTASPGSNCDVKDPVEEDPQPDPCGGPTGGSPGSTGCTIPGCGGDGKSGGGSGDSKECCETGVKYTRCDFGGCAESCYPFDPPSGCSSYCTEHWYFNGEYADGCSQGNTCSECSDCWQYLGGGAVQAYKCRPRGINTPCYCKSSADYGDCKRDGDCYLCDKNPKSPSFGDCRKECNGCYDNCNCFITCRCGIQLKGTWSQPHCQSGLACPSACRENLAKECEKYCPPPPPDPCKADPNNPCEKDCDCITVYRECDQSLGQPPNGCTWTQLGFISTCGQPPESFPENSPGPQKAYIMRTCCGQAGDGCKCRNGVGGPQIRKCPECQVCNSEGRCETPEDGPCDNYCPWEVCDGVCCPYEETCVASCTWTVVDACHGAGFTFRAPCTASITKGNQTPISKEDAVCNRYHTHCPVLANGQTVGTHLDCQAAITANGPDGRRMCSGDTSPLPI